MPKSINVRHLNDEELRKTIAESKIPVFVDFYADWCPPCRAVAPVIEEIAQEYEDKVIFTKINTDQNQAIARENGVSAIPTFIIFKEGKSACKFVGALPKNKITENIDKILKD